MDTLIQTAIKELGSYRVAVACGVKGPSVCKWALAGRLPRTEWTGETSYAEKIETLSEGKYKKEALLQLPTPDLASVTAGKTEVVESS